MTTNLYREEYLSKIREVPVYPDEWQFVREGLRQLSLTPHYHKECWGDEYRTLQLRVYDWLALQQHLGGLIPYYDARRAPEDNHVSIEMMEQWGDYEIANKVRVSILRIIQRIEWTLSGIHIGASGHVQEDVIREEIDGGGIKGGICLCQGRFECEPCVEAHKRFKESMRTDYLRSQVRSQSPWNGIRQHADKQVGGNP